MAKEFIRLWIQEDTELIGKHLLIVGESYSDCGNCRQLGLDFTKVKRCPECNTEFKYITSRYAGGGAADRFRWLRRITEQRPELPFVDYDDYQKHMSRHKARDIFS